MNLQCSISSEARLASQLIDLTNEVEEGSQAAYQRTGILLVVPSSRTSHHHSFGDGGFYERKIKIEADGRTTIDDLYNVTPQSWITTSCRRDLIVFVVLCREEEERRCCYCLKGHTLLALSSEIASFLVGVDRYLHGGR